MKTLMKALFVMAMALTLVYSAHAGLSDATQPKPVNEDFIITLPADYSIIP